MIGCSLDPIVWEFKPNHAPFTIQDLDFDEHENEIRLLLQLHVQNEKGRSLLFDKKNKQPYNIPLKLNTKKLWSDSWLKIPLLGRFYRLRNKRIIQNLFKKSVKETLKNRQYEEIPKTLDHKFKKMNFSEVFESEVLQYTQKTLKRLYQQKSKDRLELASKEVGKKRLSRLTNKHPLSKTLDVVFQKKQKGEEIITQTIDTFFDDYQEDSLKAKIKSFTDSDHIFSDPLFKKFIQEMSIYADASSCEMRKRAHDFILETMEKSQQILSSWMDGRLESKKKDDNCPDVIIQQLETFVDTFSLASTNAPDELREKVRERLSALFPKYEKKIKDLYQIDIPGTKKQLGNQQKELSKIDNDIQKIQQTQKVYTECLSKYQNTSLLDFSTPLSEKEKKAIESLTPKKDVKDKVMMYIKCVDQLLEEDQKQESVTTKISSNFQKHYQSEERFLDSASSFFKSSYQLIQEKLSDASKKQTNKKQRLDELKETYKELGLSFPSDDSQNFYAQDRGKSIPAYDKSEVINVAQLDALYRQTLSESVKKDEINAEETDFFKFLQLRSKYKQRRKTLAENLDCKEKLSSQVQNLERLIKTSREKKNLLDTKLEKLENRLKLLPQKRKIQDDFSLGRKKSKRFYEPPFKEI